MALELAWYGGSDKRTGQCFGRLISSQSFPISGTAANSSAAPENAAIVNIYAAEACRVSNKTGVAASATAGQYLPIGGVMQMEVNPGDVISALTA